MHRIIIHGGKRLNGEINISGAKNSAVALIPGAILCDENVVIKNVPNISDVDSLEEMLLHLNAKIERKNNEVFISSSNIKNIPIKKDLAKKLRASYYFMGALLGKFKHVEMCFPGGCTIGERPIDIHLRGFRALGATVIENGDNFIIHADKLVGTKIDLSFASVGATINLLYAAVKAEGKTIITNAAKEPEIINVADYLNKMGAKIVGAGTSEIIIEGVNYLHSCEESVIPDRIETGTYEIIAAAIGDKIRINNINPYYMEALNNKLKEMNVNLSVDDNKIEVLNSTDYLKGCDVVTEVFPGFPTDLQQVLATLMAISSGKSSIKETIYENRFNNLIELEKMGAVIKIEGDLATITGVKELNGCEVNATDLRAGAGLIVAGLIAKGTTIINNADYILRGYDSIIEKLTNIGADIELQEV